MFNKFILEKTSCLLSAQESLEKKKVRLKNKGKSTAFIEYKINNAYKRIEYKVYLKYKFSIFDELEHIISEEVKIKNNDMLKYYVDIRDIKVGFSPP